MLRRCTVVRAAVAPEVTSVEPSERLTEQWTRTAVAMDSSSGAGMVLPTSAWVPDWCTPLPAHDRHTPDQ